MFSKLKVVAVASLLSLTIAGCAGTPKVPVGFAMLDGSLSGMMDAFVVLSEKEPIGYDVTGVAKYDAFFRRAAILRANVLLATHYAEATAGSVQGLIDNKKDEDIQAVLSTANGLVKYLAKAAANAAELATTAKSLVESAKDDFSSSPMKLPGVVSALGGAAENLAALLTSIPELGTALGGIVTTVTASME